MAEQIVQPTADIVVEPLPIRLWLPELDNWVIPNGHRLLVHGYLA
jgi:hypothetical protein